MPRELDVVRFNVPIGGWPAGTTATVIDRYSKGATVEIDNSLSAGIDLVSVNYEDVSVVWSASENRVAVEG